MSEFLGEAHPILLGAFLLLSLVVLGSAAAVVTRRQPVTAIGWLVVHFVATAGAYLVLDSEFVAAVQVLVYAGAIMVLFLFVIMLLSADRAPDPGLAAGTGRKVLVGCLLIVLVAAFARVAAAPSALLPSAGGGTVDGEGTVEWIADALFTRHLVAFEVASLPLLAAMAGVMIFATRRDRRPSGGQSADHGGAVASGPAASNSPEEER